MTILTLSLVVLSLLSSFGLVQGHCESKDQQSLPPSISTQKTRREILQEAHLKALFAKVGVSVEVENGTRNNQPQTFREVKVRWASIVSNSEASSSVSTQLELTPNISVLESKKRFGTLPRRRSLELSPTQVLIAAVDKKNQLRWWSIVADPRVVRSESQTSAGDLLSKNYYLSNTTLVVAFPDDPQIVDLRFYHLLWTGSEFSLTLMAIAPVQ